MIASVEREDETRQASAMRNAPNSPTRAKAVETCVAIDETKAFLGAEDNRREARLG